MTHGDKAHLLHVTLDSGAEVRELEQGLETSRPNPTGHAGQAVHEIHRVLGDVLPNVEIWKLCGAECSSRHCLGSRGPLSVRREGLGDVFGGAQSPARITSLPTASQFDHHMVGAMHEQPGPAHHGIHIVMA